MITTNRFETEFDDIACDGDTIRAEIDGFVVVATLRRDDSGETPWEAWDGSGPVSDWTSRPKLPGERILSTSGSQKRYYDWAEAIKIAKRDSWGVENSEGLTPGQIAELAVEKDFKYLEGWCNDDWYFGVVILSVMKCGVVLAPCAASCGGLEVNAGGNKHLTEVANDLLDEALDYAKDILRQLCDCK